jgi:plastocyanin
LKPLALTIAIWALAAWTVEAGETAPAKPGARARVVGVVRYVGDIPRSWLADEASPVAAAPLAAEPDPTKMKPPKAVSLTRDGRVQYVVVALENEAAAAAVKAKEPPTVEIDQLGSIFAPHVTVVPPGAKVVFKNSDGINHNVHVVSDRQEKNVFLKAGENREVTLRLADNTKIVCDLHSWMRASLVVAPTPYFAVTDAEGRFAIEGVPPGKFTLKLIHPRLKPEQPDVQIEVPASGELALEPRLALGGR